MSERPKAGVAPASDRPAGPNASGDSPRERRRRTPDWTPGRSPWQIAWRRLRRDPLTLAAGALLLGYALLAVGAPWVGEVVASRGPEQIDLLRTFEGPNPRAWLGTDDYGRDQLVRILYGARVSLGIGFLAAAINILVGLAIGAVAAYYGGWVDDLVTWLINTLRAIPLIFLVLLISALFRPRLEVFALILGLLVWPNVARVIRGQTLSVKQRDYVLAARALGATDTWIIARHILPNVLPLTIVILGIDVANVILLESALSFIGFGVRAPDASWGNMLTNAQDFFYQAPHLVWVPGFFIWTTVLALYLVADGVRDALDPTLRD